mgnify:CR=1 FL=1
MTDLPDGAGWAGAIAGLATIGTWGYNAWRKTRVDKQQDQKTGAELALIGKLQDVVASQEKRIDQLVESYEKRLNLLNDRLDKMAEARNIALTENARLNEVVKGLEGDLTAATETSSATASSAYDMP